MAKKEVVNTGKAPQAIGPYSQGIKAGGFLFLSGQIPLDQDSGKVSGKDITEQTKVVMNNIGAILEEASLGFHSVVMATVYLKDMSDFSEFNSVYGGYFADNPPSRACVEVARLPKDVLVEVVVTALIDV